jgi:hypothetical protein
MALAHSKGIINFAFVRLKHWASSTVFRQKQFAATARPDLAAGLQRKTQIDAPDFVGAQQTGKHALG